MKNRFFPVLAFPFLLALGGGSVLLGQAPPPDEDPTGHTGALKSQIQTGGSYDAHSANGTRIVTDLRVPGAPGSYGLDFTRYWNSLHSDYENAYALRPEDFGMSGWTHSWRWKAQYYSYSEPVGDDGQHELHTTGITITFPDGHTTNYKVLRPNWPIPPYTPPPELQGPPYSQAEIDAAWPNGGVGVNDHLYKMDPWGLDFWLCLADGGAVHFVRNGNFGYQATEVFDPHGLKTDLVYTNGYLTHVIQEGGRSLVITWSSFGLAGRAITRVESGGTGGLQSVTYKYQSLTSPYGGGYLVLVAVFYPNDRAPGQHTSAKYTYGYDFFPGSTPSRHPLLKVADDPRYAGPMTKIAYEYSGVACPTPTPPPAGHYHPTYFHGQPYGIKKEKSAETDLAVSSFEFPCLHLWRKETNGFGGWRNFYFGDDAATAEWEGGEHFFCFGYQLGKVTDFHNGLSGNPPFHLQNFYQGHPRHTWDARENKTKTLYQDASGSPSEIYHYADQSSYLYDRITPSPAPILDPSCMHNPYHIWLFSKRDEGLNVTTYTRDARRRVTDIGYQGNSAEHYTYNGFNQVETHTLPSGAVQTYVYDTSHRLLQVRNDVDLAISNLDYIEYAYYGPTNHPEWTGLVETMTDGRARVSGKPFTAKMTYNGRQQVTSVEYAATGGSAHPTVHYEYDDYGNCTAVTDERNHRKEYTYDSYRRCTSYTEPVDACGVATRKWSWVYDRVIDGVPGFVPSTHTSKEWRVQVEPAFNGGGERRMTARWFDQNNRITKEETGWIQPPGEIGVGWYCGPDIETHYITYDENGQKKTSTDPLGRVTSYVYNNRNRLTLIREYPVVTDPSPPRTTETYYDTTGNKTLVVFPDSETQQWENYDAFGQAWKFTNERGHVTDLTYCWGPMKKLHTVTTHRDKENGVEDQLTSFSYDQMGRPTRTLFPDGSDEVSSYKFGQLDTWKTRRNQIKRLHYDARGREDSHTWDAGAAPSTTRVWDDANRLTSIANLFSTINYTYDSASQVLTEASLVAGSRAAKQVSYCRYPTGEVSQMTYPDTSFVVQRAYTARGQLQSVNWTGPDDPTVNYVYLQDGKVARQDTNMVRTKYEYDGRGMIYSVRHTKLSNLADLAYRQYWRDTRDRITAWKRGPVTSENGMEDGRGDRYLYDEEGQLTLADYRAKNPQTTAPAPLRRDRFDYDALGNRRGTDNRVASRGSGAVTFSRRNNGLNQYLSWTPSAIFHDDNYPAPSPNPWVPPGNGVMMAEGYITASFNAINQPMAIWSPFYPNGTSAQYVWFGYDPLGRCVKRWVAPLVGTPPNQHGPPADSNPATYYYYDGWNLVQEGPSAAIAARTYVHGGRVDEIVASRIGGVWNYHHYDARGHCMMLTNPSGGIVEQYDYDAFGFPYFYNAAGTTIGPSLQSGNRFLFTGREWLKELRIYDYRNRMYQPEVGRFLQPDPKQFEAGDYNLYRYCHNDPVNKTDPFGLADKVYEGAADYWSDNYNPTDRIVMVAHGNIPNGAVTVVNGKTTGVISAKTIAADAIKAGYGESKNHVEVAVCEGGVGGKNSLGQKVANELYKQMPGVKPNVSAPDGKTANPSSMNDSTGKITSGPLTGVPDPAKGQSGQILHFTVEPKLEKKDQKE